MCEKLKTHKPERAWGRRAEGRLSISTLYNSVWFEYYVTSTYYF